MSVVVLPALLINRSARSLGQASECGILGLSFGILALTRTAERVNDLYALGDDTKMGALYRY